jgi:hypothetical protein
VQEKGREREREGVKKKKNKPKKLVFFFPPSLSFFPFCILLMIFVFTCPTSFFQYTHTKKKKRYKKIKREIKAFFFPPFNFFFCFFFCWFGLMNRCMGTMDLSGLCINSFLKFWRSSEAFQGSLAEK